MGSLPDEYEGLIDEVVQCTNELLLFNQMEAAAPGGINTIVRQAGGALAHRRHEVTELQPNHHHRPREELCKGFRIQRVDVPLGDLLYGFDVRLRGDIVALHCTITPEVVHVAWLSLAIFG